MYSSRKVKCPYCGQYAIFIDSARVYHGKSYGMIWLCRNYPKCDAYIGCHEGTDIPKGRMANKQLRTWKILAHKAFDPLWKSGRMTRKAAYRYMQQIMKMSPKEAHIGKFDVPECRKLVRALFGKEDPNY